MAVACLLNDFNQETNVFQKRLSLLFIVDTCTTSIKCTLSVNSVMYFWPSCICEIKNEKFITKKLSTVLKTLTLKLL